MSSGLFWNQSFLRVHSMGEMEAQKYNIFGPMALRLWGVVKIKTMATYDCVVVSVEDEV